MDMDIVTLDNTPPVAPEIIEKVIAEGDLSKLTPQQRVSYYRAVCNSLGLNPLTKPFEYIRLNGKLTLYARRDAADQLRNLHNISIEITEREFRDDLYIVQARATTPNGRKDEATGVVYIGNLKGEALANALMKAECVPLESEILTREGWKTYDQLQIGEEVLAYDCETDTCRWVPLLDVTVHERLPMSCLHTEKGQFEVFCTPDHSWAIRKQEYRPRSTGKRGVRGPYKNRQPDRMLVEARRIKSSHSLILAAPEVGTAESLLNPVEAAILGWAVTDGTIKRVGNSVRIGICQSKEQNFEVIRKLIAKVAPGVKELVSPPRSRTFPTGRTYQTKEQHWWYLPAKISREILGRAGFHERSDLPKIVTRLSPLARKAMLQAMMLAEGDARGCFANGDRYIIDSFQILCALEGIATGREKPRLGIIYLRKKKTRHVAGAFLRMELMEEQPAWCPTTPLGTWVMRQNGQVMITGNTKAKRRVTLSLVGLGWLDETEVLTIPDAQPVEVDAETGEIKEQEPPKPKTNGKKESALDKARRRVFALAKKLDIPGDDLANLLRNQFGVESRADMTLEDWETAIPFLKVVRELDKSKIGDRAKLLSLVATGRGKDLHKMTKEDWEKVLSDMDSPIYWELLIKEYNGDNDQTSAPEPTSDIPQPDQEEEPEGEPETEALPF